MHTHTHKHIQVRRQPSVPHLRGCRLHPLVIFEIGSLAVWELTKYIGWLASKSQASTCLCLHGTRIISVHHDAYSFHVDSEYQTETHQLRYLPRLLNC